MTVSEQIIEVLDALCEKFGLAIDWTAGNVLPYVESLCVKLITWEIWTSVYWIGLMTLLSVIFLFVSKKITKRYVKERDNGKYCAEEGWLAGAICSWIVFGFIAIASMVVIGIQIHDIITCVTFPEMMLVEKIQGLIQTTG
jgi:hypothetical protein